MKSPRNQTDLTLYIHSKSPLSRSALKNLKKLSSNASFNSKYNLNIIEVDIYPDIAEQKKILATPLLVYNSNNYETRILGNFSDLHSVYEVLGIEGELDE